MAKVEQQLGEDARADAHQQVGGQRDQQRDGEDGELLRADLEGAPELRR